ncbi:hypothetical protein ACFQZS_18210 [Mucilaginibacter calamicampi]|uniref:Outer membrane protein beta-barrel domain-containing protein n=1 Tax=Mucilaginibacter calamicampi TaxID=1302352 RepID=A0ABW2Z2M6_9SPHI
MKKLLLLFFVLVLANPVKSQSYNYNTYGLGVYYNALYPYADLASAKNSSGVSVVGYYNLSLFLPLGLEFQTGELAGGGVLTDLHGREYKNKYTAIIARGDVFLGQIMGDYGYRGPIRYLKDFYAGTGVGLISNNMAFIQRVSPGSNYVFPGKDKSMNLMVPIRVGYELKINNSYGEPFIGVNLGYVMNITWGEGLDGYDDSAKDFKNNVPDLYRQIVLGIKVNFGPSKSNY